MEYTVSQLAHLSRVSARTLRYYDEIDLLKPYRVSSNGYRIYGPQEVDLLQQILFYKELALPLDEIKQIIHSENFDINVALKNHLIQLNRKKQRLEELIQAVEKTLQTKKGASKMSDQEKFDAFKKDQLRRNEEQYGREIREKYGKNVVEKSNEKAAGMTQADYHTLKQLTEQLNEELRKATKEGQPESACGQAVAALHQKWIKQTWPEGYYSEEKHYHLSRMYIEDPRFTAYYNQIEPGAADFLHEALKIYLERHE